METRRNLKLLGVDNAEYYSKLTDVKTYINCDIRYFNLDFLVEKVGSFDGNHIIVFSDTHGSSLENQRRLIKRLIIYVY